MKPYRPSNGSDGELFMLEFCYRCERYDEDTGCPILFASMAYDLGDAEYPKEWVKEDDGSEARCTAFQAEP